jgi:hypothetical protein
MVERTNKDAAASNALHRVAKQIAALDEERRELNYHYAANELSAAEFVAASRTLDEKVQHLTVEKTKLAAALRSPGHEDFVDASVRQFCATVKARLQGCTGGDDKRAFLLDHVEQVVYTGYHVAVIGSAPVRAIAGESKLPFRIEGTINIKKVRSEALSKAARRLWQAEMAANERAAVVEVAVAG